MQCLTEVASQPIEDPSVVCWTGNGLENALSIGRFVALTEGSAGRWQWAERVESLGSACCWRRGACEVTGVVAVLTAERCRHWRRCRPAFRGFEPPPALQSMAAALAATRGKGVSDRVRHY